MFIDEFYEESHEGMEYNVKQDGTTEVAHGQFMKFIVWHIETNRDILRDKRTLDDIWGALKRMVETTKSEN